MIQSDSILLLTCGENGGQQEREGTARGEKSVMWRK